MVTDDSRYVHISATGRGREEEKGICPLFYYLEVTPITSAHTSSSRIYSHGCEYCSGGHVSSQTNISREEETKGIWLCVLGGGWGMGGQLTVSASAP